VRMRLVNGSSPAISTMIIKVNQRTNATNGSEGNELAFVSSEESSLMLPFIFFPSVCSDGVVVRGGEAGFSDFFTWEVTPSRSWKRSDGACLWLA
jgi:hypothetical protein